MLHHTSVLCDDELNLFSFIVSCDLTTMPTLGESMRRDWIQEMASPGNERKRKEASNCPVARTHDIYKYLYIKMWIRGLLVGQKIGHGRLEVTNRVAPIAAPLAIPIRNVDLTHGR